MSSKEKMSTAKDIAGYVAIILVLWLIVILFALFAKSVSNYEVIQPIPGIQCVVVSRMFNTSVDCWEEKKP